MSCRVAVNGRTDRNLRIEAASFQGKPVFFSLIGDWTKPDRIETTRDIHWGKKIGQLWALFY